MEFMETAIVAGCKDINHVRFICSYLENGAIIGGEEGRHPTFRSNDPTFSDHGFKVMDLDEDLRGPYLQMCFHSQFYCQPHHNPCEDNWANTIKLICHIHMQKVELGIVKPSIMTKGKSTRQFQYSVSIVNSSMALVYETLRYRCLTLKIRLG